MPPHNMRFAYNQFRRIHGERAGARDSTLCAKSDWRHAYIVSQATITCKPLANPNIEARREKSAFCFDTFGFFPLVCRRVLPFISFGRWHTYHTHTRARARLNAHSSQSIWLSCEMRSKKTDSGDFHGERDGRPTAK